MTFCQASNEKREHLYKVLVIGELGTGKTSIIKRYVHQFFSQHYRATVRLAVLLTALPSHGTSISSFHSTTEPRYVQQFTRSIADHRNAHVTQVL